MNIVSTIVEAVTDFVAGMGGAFLSAFQHLFMIEDSAGVFTGLNDLGVTVLIFFGISLGYGCIRFVCSLFRGEAR